MRQRKPITSYVSALICLLVIGYFATQIWNYYTNPFSTTTIYPYQAYDSVSVSGYLVRSETVLSNQDSGVLSHSRNEGERVSTGGEVARVYADQTALDNQAAVEDLELLVEQLDYAQGALQNPEITLSLDGNILNALTDFRATAVSGDLDGVQDLSDNLRNLVVTQSFTQESEETLLEWAATASSDLSTAQRNTTSATKTIRSSDSGIYSAVVDGYEHILTVESVFDWTPSALDAIEPDSEVYSNVGKMIEGDTWYYVVNVDAKTASLAKEVSTVELEFTKSFDTVLTMTVEQVSAQEDGQHTLVLSSDRYMGELTLLRNQSALLIFNTLEGFRVPLDALRVDENGNTGIYCLIGLRARFKPVSVVYEGSDFMLVESNTTIASDTLQNGDQVIIAANDLYDGKVIN